MRRGIVALPLLALLGSAIAVQSATASDGSGPGFHAPVM
jgi:hypothetical protein